MAAYRAHLAEIDHKIEGTEMTRLKCFALAFWLVCLNGSISHAADVGAASPVDAAQQPSTPNYGSLYVGVTTTTNYLVGGVTQTNGKPAVQPYVEYDAPFGVYVGVWGSTVDFAPFNEDRWEIDGYVGYRNTFGAFSFDASYWRTYYDNTGYYGDYIVAGADYAISDQLKVGAQVKWDFAVKDEIYSPRVSFSPFESWKISGKYEFAKDSPNTDWDFGVSKSFYDEALTVDLRYYDSNFDKPKIVLSVSAAIDALSLLPK
jgi:uncharacterized protein (TIGR02001 family)